MEVLAQAISTNNIVATNLTKTATCTEASTGSSATWTTTFTRDNLNTLQTNNMRASFSANITNDVGLTGLASPRALFVEPNIPPHDNNITGNILVPLEDIYKIGSTCRLVFVLSINTVDANFNMSWRNYISSLVGVQWFAVAISESTSLTPFVNRRNAAPEGVMSQASPLIRNSNNLIAFTSTFYFDIPDTDSNSYRIGVSTSRTEPGTSVKVDDSSLLRKTYRNCQLVPSS